MTQSPKNSRQASKKSKLKLFEAFAGYGGASFALKRAGLPYETVGFSENDKFAVALYEKIILEFQVSET